jgi:DNA polymerase-3 subunit beta
MSDRQITTFTLEAAAVLEALQRTKICISDEKTRCYLGGVHVSRLFDGKAIRFCAADGHRLSLVKAELTEGGGAVNGILSRVAVDELIAGLKALKRRISTVGMQFECRPGAWRATFAGQEIELPLIDGAFPDYDRVIPTGNDKAITFRAGESVRLRQADRSVCDEIGDRGEIPGHVDQRRKAGAWPRLGHMGGRIAW